MRNDFAFMQQKETMELSYYLCYLHQGASCSVSIPTPIYCESIRIRYSRDVLIKFSTFPDADVCGCAGHQNFANKYP